jgi:hypothetical protein
LAGANNFITEAKFHKGVRNGGDLLGGINTFLGKKIWSTKQFYLVAFRVLFKTMFSEVFFAGFIFLFGGRIFERV